ncbi:CopG family transcriptional regulator [Candidatus Woesearchaeota archaeon]|nr:CopG family transcriptional regulator [Candidatus Woesearchaeota archaeon]
MERKTTSLKIDPELWKEAKKHAIDKDIELSEYIEGLIKADITKSDKYNAKFKK